ncbi:MAG: hypothetical protein WDM77_09875 [Steroidobacteraceae bacterium]
MRTALQDSGYRYKIHPLENAAGYTDADLTFGHDVGNLLRYGGVPDGVDNGVGGATGTDNSPAIAKAFAVGAQGAFSNVFVPAGRWVFKSKIVPTFVASPILLNTLIGLVGAGSSQTVLYNMQTGTHPDALDITNGTNEFINGTIAGFTLSQPTTAGVGLVLTYFTNGCVLDDVMVFQGTSGAHLTHCWNSRGGRLWVRGCSSHGVISMSIATPRTGRCTAMRTRATAYSYRAAASKLKLWADCEFNNMDQINVNGTGSGGTSRGLTIDGYCEGIMPSSSGFAGVQLGNVDTVDVNMYMDATQTASGRDGTGNYCRAGYEGNASRVKYHAGFASIASNQVQCGLGQHGDQMRGRNSTGGRVQQHITKLPRLSQ